MRLPSVLRRQGSHIVIPGLDSENATEAKKLIEQENVKCLVIKMDVTKEDEVNAMVDKVMEEFGRIDVLVNNAGIGIGCKAEEMPFTTWKKVIDVNLTGPFLVSKAVGNVMIKQKKGSIIVISSMSGIIVNTPATQCNYNASKAGAIQLTKSLASEWAPYGIRVNTIAPGYMRTGLTEHRFKDPDNPVLKTWVAMTPMGRIGTPDELVGLAVYLASDASSFTTGAAVPVDGGYTVW